MHQGIVTGPQNKNHLWTQFPSSVDQGLSTCLLCFYFAPWLLLCPFASTCVPLLKSTAGAYLSSIFAVIFISTCLTAGITVSSQLCGIGTGWLLWSLSHGVWSRRADAIGGISLEEQYWPSEGDTAPLPRVGGPSLQIKILMSALAQKRNSRTSCRLSHRRNSKLHCTGYIG